METQNGLALERYQMSNGFILYRGPSQIDGAPIVVIATGTSGKASRNTKTGSLVQTWILREDMSPTDAVNSGADASICSDCVHRGELVEGRNVNRSCYVTVFQAPLSVWKSYKRGIYPMVSDLTGEALAGLRVRLGSYGDPAAVPLFVWENLLSDVEAVTGYIHQWRKASADIARFVMASCDSQSDYDEARALGYRTFRVRSAGEHVNAREVVCPASHEAGQKTTCAACVACDGHSSKARANVVIIAHGAASKVAAFNRRAPLSGAVAA